ncbi:xanthine dehydrogenase family protein molybdopterin-binding subunit [Actinomadura decatromicini]|uniref:Xanthine dehydrogenase family protein molybdopterin-binding subunit n=1 Tax=Actinomadura decatromicini TaxID=2604572 RepID=A0A5D3F7R7_9ACTN|nr:xanthine dehydrogenase family protein molybdopterin-binding subunit [Actinomadura decatromicini]TYK44109.1 xanthine dehydrogenase family protein molybdopterin-binding subunit [Actinomadura decatromicini]
MEDHETTPPRGAIGVARPRAEGPGKVSGRVRYAADEPLENLAFGHLVTAPVTRGRITRLDAAAVRDMPGVLAVIDHTNAPRLNPEAGSFFGPDGTLQLLQEADVPFAGRPVALVVAETWEQARRAASALPVEYAIEPHDIAFTAEHPAARPALDLFGPEAALGDPDAGLAASAVVVDERYRTPEEHCSAMEPHSATAWWDGNDLHASDSNQGPWIVAAALSALFGLDQRRVHIRAEHVGGGFGSKGLCGPQLILAVMGATLTGRPVQVTLTRAQVFLATAMRPPTDQRVMIGADADGRFQVIRHDAAFAVSPLVEYIEGCTEPTKALYAAPAIHTTLTAVPVDTVPPYSMRAPGAAPGSFALECAVDEVAERLGMDPVELRSRNEPSAGPVSGLPFSSRELTACLREGARRFGWAERDHRPRLRREGPLLTGTGVAATSFGVGAFPSSASITAETDGTFTVSIGASDIGTGARTALGAVAADTLGVEIDRIRLRIADSDLGMAWGAGGSRGTTSWAWAITEAAGLLRREKIDGRRPVTVTADTSRLLGDLMGLERHAYSAVFAEVTVDPATGEIRVRRLLGMFAIGRVVNPLLARSQVVGGMIGGLSMALHEEGVRDPHTGRQVNADFAGYHIAAHADVPDIEADFVPDHEPGIPLGIKGAGEIGNVGTAAAIANAVWHATGVRHRTLPLRLDRVLESR